jgi:DNA excision repair protein ERCC-2
MRDTDQEQLQNEYQKLVQGLRDADDARQEDAFMANPGKPAGVYNLATFQANNL